VKSVCFSPRSRRFKWSFPQDPFPNGRRTASLSPKQDWNQPPTLPFSPILSRWLAFPSPTLLLETLLVGPCRHLSLPNQVVPPRGTFFPPQTIFLGQRVVTLRSAILFYTLFFLTRTAAARDSLPSFFEPVLDLTQKTGPFPSSPIEKALPFSLFVAMSRARSFFAVSLFPAS